MRRILTLLLIFTFAFSVYTELQADGFGGGGAFGSVINYLKRAATNIIPSKDDTYSLGSATKEWKDAYIDGTLYVDTISGITFATEVFKTISTAGQSDIVADTLTDTLTLVGSGILGITTNAGTDTITLTATEVDGSTTNEFNTVQGDSNTATTGLAISIDGGEGINTAVSGDILTITGETATDTNLGIAKFNANDFLVSTGDVTVKADGITDLQIDFGTGANQVSAVDLPIADAGVIITATEVEGALQEHRTAINLNTSKVTNATHTGEVTGSGALALDPTCISGKVDTTIADGDFVLFWDLTDSTLKKVDGAELTAGGAETNSLETICTGILTTEIPIGTAADTVVYAALSGEATMANNGAITLADSVAVTNWNLTTPTITTKATCPEIENTGNITIDAINAAAASTVTITNSDATYKANLSVENQISGAVYGSDGSVTDAELLYINTLSSNAQTQITANTNKTTESTTVTSPLVLTTYDISIPAATNAAAGHASAAHVTAIEANTTHAGDNTQAHTDYFLNTGADTAGAGAGFAWTFNASAGADPTLTFGDGTVAVAGTLSATALSGDLTGNVTGDVSGSSGSCTGNAATATILETTRAIYGNNFDGSAPLTGIIASTYGGTGNGFTKFTGPTTAEKTFTLPDATSTLIYSGGALGTPSGGTLTSCTGLPYTGLANGTDGNLITWAADATIAVVATGDDGQVLTSAGVGQPPAFETLTGGDVTGPGSSVDNEIARFHSTTGKVIQAYTSGGPTISDTGLVTMSANSGSRGFKSASNQTDISDTTETQVVMDGESYDIRTEFASNEFTPGVTGDYLVSGAVYFNQMVVSRDYYLRFRLNDTIVRSNLFRSPSNGTGMIVMLAPDVMTIAAGVHLDMSVYLSVGVGTVDINKGEAQCFISANRIR